MAGPRYVRQVNRQLMVELFSDGEPRSRAAVARATGLAKPSVSAIIDSLLDEGVLITAGVGEAGDVGGRRPNLVAFNPDARAHLGIHLGVERSSVAIADALGRTLAQGSVTSSAGDPERGVKNLRAVIRRTASRAGVPVERIASAGVSVAGLVDHRNGHCVLAPNLEWRDVPLRELVEHHLEVPAVVYNEAHAGALAEQANGAADGVQSFVRLNVGYGVGSGVVLESRLYCGSTGIGGEVGHCCIDPNGRQCACGNRGCVETVAARPGILRTVAEATRDGARTSLTPDSDFDDILTAAHNGDEVATRALHDAGTGLGRGIAYLLNVLNPERVVIGGPVAAAGDLLLNAARKAIPQTSLRQAACDVELSPLSDAEVDGAVILARSHVGF